MHIKINNKYHLTADSRQFILHEKTGKDGKNETLSYFTSIDSMVKSLIMKQVRMNENIRTLSQLGKRIDLYANEIKKAFIL